MAHVEDDPDLQALARTLDCLVWLEFDLVQAYEKAAERIADGPYRDQLRKYMDDHMQRVVELRECLREFGATPPSIEQLQAYVGGKSALGVGLFVDAPSVLRLMWSNEDEANCAYQQALNQSAFVPRVREVLKDALEQGRQRWTWIATNVERQPSRARD
jgi:hypothetical protein